MKPVQGAVLGMIILGSFVVLLCQGQEISDNLACLGCHQDVANQVSIYMHLPFSQQNCSSCHLVSEGILEEGPVVGSCTRDGIGQNDLGTSVCYKCHTKEKLGVSHPVGVFPSEKIQIPDVLPKGTEGQLLCISCHCPHGSDEEYLGRKPVSAQLCIACHGVDYYE